jgi:hypothetical protein
MEIARLEEAEAVVIPLRGDSAAPISVRTRTSSCGESNDPAGQRPGGALSSSIALSTHMPCVVARSPPQARGCDIRTLSTGLKLRPHDVLGDPFPPCECTKAAIGTGNDALPVADRRHRGLNALRHDLRVLNQVDLRVDDPGLRALNGRGVASIAVVRGPRTRSAIWGWWKSRGSF